MISLVVCCCFVLLSLTKGQNSWPYSPFQQQQIPTPTQQHGTIPLNGFPSLGSNGIGQPFNGFTYGQRPIYGAPIPQPIPPPRMQLLRIQLICESVPAQQPPIIRWIRRDSAAVTSTPITIADGANAVDPLQYAVSLEQLPSGSTRSILTILKPEPDSSQAAYYCQTVSPIGSSNSESREVYVIGNRQFVNANMAYHAADTFRGINQPRSTGAEPVREAVLVVTPVPYTFMNHSDWLIYHSPSPDRKLISTPMNVNFSTTADYAKTVLDKPV